MASKNKQKNRQKSEAHPSRHHHPHRIGGPLQRDRIRLRFRQRCHYNVFIDGYSPMPTLPKKLQEYHVGIYSSGSEDLEHKGHGTHMQSDNEQARM